MLKNIIWDLDGTLFDTYPAINHAFQTAAYDLGADVPIEHIASLNAISMSHCVQTLSSEYALDPEDLGMSFQIHYAQARPEDQKLFPGVLRVLEHIIAAGGLNLIFTHRRRKSTQVLLNTLHIAPLIAEYRTPEDGYPRKPEPAGFLALIADHHLNPQETLAVGDRELDIAAGKAAGLPTCLFGKQPEDFGADLHIDDYQQLLDFIAQNL